MRLTLIGHMTVWIELDGVGILTDPWFGPHGRLERRLAPQGV
jgi:L-ascorbate metabolism protein UlaG (beta-lactamase superfamily)